MFAPPLPTVPAGAACSLFVPVARPASAEAVAALCGPVDRYVRRSGARLVVCDADALAADLRTLDALARLHLAGRRVGCLVRFRYTPIALVDLATFVGLDEVLRLELVASGVETRRQAEQREQPLRVEEEHDPAELVLGDVEHLQ